MNQKIRIAIADKHYIYRQGVIALLQKKENINIAFDVASGKELLNSLEACQPDIIILDVDMPELDGKATLVELTARYPEIKVIILTSYYNDRYVIDFISQGATAFLPKRTSIDTIHEAINKVYTYGFYFDDCVIGIIERQSGAIVSKTEGISKTKFTRRESEVLKFLRLGKTSTEIADILCVSPRTIEWHRFNLSKKAG